MRPPHRRVAPSNRPGSRWQQRPGPIAYLATNWATVRRPWRRWGVVSPRPANGLLALNCLLVGALLALGLGAPALLDGYDGEILGVSAITVFAAPFVLFSLSQVEAVGLRNLSQRVAGALVRLAAADPAGLVRVSQGQIAALVAATRPKVNVVLAELRARGLVETARAGLRLPDPAALRALAEAE